MLNNVRNGMTRSCRNTRMKSRYVCFLRDRADIPITFVLWILRESRLSQWLPYCFFSFLLSQFSRFRACFDNIPSLLIEELYIFIFIFSGVPKRRWGKRDWKGPGNSSVVRSWTVPGLGCPTVRIAVIIKWTSRTKPASFNREKATRPHQKKKKIKERMKRRKQRKHFPVLPHVIPHKLVSRRRGSTLKNSNSLRHTGPAVAKCFYYVSLNHS